jgi:acetyl esterase/lipase
MHVSFFACISLVLASIFISISSSSNAQPLARSEPEKLLNIPYVKGGTVRQTLDLYLPRNKRAPYPVVVWIHGGSWMHGDKAENCLPARDLSNDFAIASINYRYSTDASFPAQVHDCKAAIRFLRANAKKYRIDPDRIGVWGSSAGGHLASLIGTTGDSTFEIIEGRKKGEPKVSSRVQAVCDWCGPTNLLSAQSQAGPKNKFSYSGPGSAVYSLMFTNMHPQVLLAASPVNYVTADDPPFLIMHGDQDDAVPLAQSQEFYDLLKKAGVRSELLILKNRGHSFDYPEYIEKVRKFFLQTL